MVAFKVFIIFMALFLLQSTFSKPLDNTNKSVDSSVEKYISTKQGLLIYTVTNLLILATKYIDQSVKISRELLKDEDLLANDKPEVLEFKTNITKFVDIYDTNNDLEKTSEIMEIFAHTIDRYLELPKEKETPESLFIVEILNKYKVKEIEIEFKNDFEKFAENFKGLFEAAKKELSKAYLDWYEKFKVLTDFDEQFEALNEFVILT